MTVGPIQVQVADACASNADDLAYLALRDLASITGDLGEYRVVGGHMVNLLRLAFPAAGAIVRRTSDADAAIGLQIAADGRMHDRLLDLGYRPESGNHYILDGRTIDLLIPSGTSSFTQEEKGGRSFDAAPGLMLDPETPHFAVTVTVVFRDGDEAVFTVRVPTVERAVILKSYAVATRNEAKDLVDLYNLLLIAREHDPGTIGGWQLGETQLAGTRADAARILGATLFAPTTRRQLEGTGVSAASLQALALKSLPAVRALRWPGLPGRV